MHTTLWKHCMKKCSATHKPFIIAKLAWKWKAGSSSKGAEPRKTNLSKELNFPSREASKRNNSHLQQEPTCEQMPRNIHALINTHTNSDGRGVWMDVTLKQVQESHSPPSLTAHHIDVEIATSRHICQTDAATLHFAGGRCNMQRKEKKERKKLYVFSVTIHAVSQSLTGLQKNIHPLAGSTQ